MATSDLERMLDDWAIAWSSNDPELILEDVTFGAVARGKEELRSFANGAFVKTPISRNRLLAPFA
jgi:hypothetical protein